MFVMLLFEAFLHVYISATQSLWRDGVDLRSTVTSTGSSETWCRSGGTWAVTAILTFTSRFFNPICHQHQIVCISSSILKRINQSFGANLYSFLKVEFILYSSVQCFSVSVPKWFQCSSVFTYLPVTYTRTNTVFGPGLTFRHTVVLPFIQISHSFSVLLFYPWATHVVRDSSMNVAICLLFLQRVIYNTKTWVY